IAILIAVLATGALTGCSGGDLTGVGGDQILSFVDDLAQPVTFLYCPAQGCARPLIRRLQPHHSWRVASETVNGAGAVSIRIGHRLKGCRLVPAIGFDVRPLATYRASFVDSGPACVGVAGSG
ncbi:MAG TPA: hypothetical protein VHV76_01230, partial [Mycobacteriales bacterium]|nr:hypothetical protein [Mycobacteriales bacterium]